MRARGIRWWPGAGIVLLSTAALLIIRGRESVPFQQRNLETTITLVITFALLLLWWTIFSRTRWKLRWAMIGLVLAVMGAAAALFRVSGFDGDLVPIVEPRWARRPVVSGVSSSPVSVVLATNVLPTLARPNFPQFLGPDRTGVLAGPALDPDWRKNPPRVLWQQPIGAAWSGFAIVGNRALSQEQRGEEELVTCYELETGRLLWSHADAAHYQTALGGEGPRCTPTVVGDRVYALGAKGHLNCLDLTTGRTLWQRNIGEDAGSGVPGWGFSGSPLVLNGRVHVSAGGKPMKSMLAYDAVTGSNVWAQGRSSVGYSSPQAATLAGTPQILIFNSSRIAGHDAQNGTVLWEYPWGVGQPHVAMPIVVGSNRVIFTSGYGVGAELLEIGPGPTNPLAATRVWKSIRMKAKFSNPVARDGFLYGLDDGVLACVDLKDGSLKWKEGRYGHGQGLLVGEHYLLMAENGELVLLRPTPEGPNELGRFRIFDAKTWNPIALSGPLLVVRNDREAACLMLKLRHRQR